MAKFYDYNGDLKYLCIPSLLPIKDVWIGKFAWFKKKNQQRPLSPNQYLLGTSTVLVHNRYFIIICEWMNKDSSRLCLLNFFIQRIKGSFAVIFISGGGGLLTKLCLTLETPWTVAFQAPLSMGFSRQEYWSGLPFPSPGNLPYPEVEPGSPAMQADSLPIKLQGKPIFINIKY